MRHQNKLFILILSFVFSISAYAQPDADKPIKFKDQQILDDLIVDGSACIGLDCVNGENFGFKTLRLKENNLRIHFDDTSTAASFPSADWCIQINDSSNGGGNYYGIFDEDNGYLPFRIERGAGAHALYVSDSGGNIGMNTSNPVVELHIVDGDSPTIRLEQNGSSGFTPQTWDLAGNETNFFIRDVTNGSKLPFRIRPNTGTSALDLFSDKIIMNEAGADSDLRIESDTETDAFFIDGGNGNVGFGTQTVPAEADVLVEDDSPRIYLQDDNSTDAINAQIQFRGSTTNLKSFIGHEGSGVLRIAVESNNALEFQTNAMTRLTVAANGDVVHHAAGNVHTSDRRLKSNINAFNRGLAEVMQLKTKTFDYNGTGGLKSVRKQQVGLIAQELQKVVPEMVTEVELREASDDGESETSEAYLGIRENEIKYLLINSIQEQQEMIKAQEVRMDELMEENNELRKMVETLQKSVEAISVNSIELEDNIGSAILEQNVPNPFNGNTQINYVIPQHAINARIDITDATGKMLKTFTISDKGAGVLNVKASEMSQGNYFYSLIVDNNVISTKQMVLAR